MKTVLVTGSSGGIGRVVVPLLCGKGYKVVGLDLVQPDPDNLSLENFTFVCGSILEPEENLTSIADNITHVIHLAAISSLPECESDPFKAFETNFLGTVKLVSFFFKYKIEVFINASTSAVYEGSELLPFSEKQACSPYLVYPQTKIMSENYLISQSVTRRIPAVSLRFFNVIGPYQDYSRTSPPLLNYLIREYLEGRQPLLHSDGNQERDYISVYDVCNAIQIVLENYNLKNKVYNICSGETLSVQTIDAFVRAYLKTELLPVYRPANKLWDSYPKLFQGAYPLNQEIISSETTKKSSGTSELFAQSTGWKVEKPIYEIIGQICEDTITHIKGDKK